MKLPNGFGTIVKLSGNRRRPYVVKEGKTGQQKIIGYAATKEEGLTILASYNQNPWDLDAKKVTFSELYELFLEKRTGKMSKSSISSLKSAYKHCSALYGMSYSSIKAYHMKDCIDRCNLSYSSKNAIKNLFYHLDRFAMELDIITKQYSLLVESEAIPETEKKTFTDEEVAALWENQYDPGVDSVLFLLYSGWRISEALDIKLTNIDLGQGTISGGVKTSAGKNRIVPIHSKVLPIVKKRMELSKSGYLFELSGKKVAQKYYRQYIWDPVMKKLHMEHTPHECRHTFRSRLDSAGANKKCIDLMMGHKSKDVGERVYTHKTIDELKMNIELITN